MLPFTQALVFNCVREFEALYIETFAALWNLQRLIASDCKLEILRLQKRTQLKTGCDGSKKTRFLVKLCIYWRRMKWKSSPYKGSWYDVSITTSANSKSRNWTIAFLYIFWVWPTSSVSHVTISVPDSFNTFRSLASLLAWCKVPSLAFFNQNSSYFPSLMFLWALFLQYWFISH